MRIAVAFAGLLFLTLLPASSNATLVTQWNFNSTTPDGSTTTGVSTPSTGSGTLSLVGGITNTFATGSPGDPASSGTDNSGINTAAFPAQGTNSGTAGLQFAASTAGYTNIAISLDLRQSATASRYYQLLVSSDGTTFAAPSGGTATFGTVNTNTGTSFSSGGQYSNDPGASSQTYVQSVTYTFAPGSAFENNPSFKFKWVSIFDPTGANGSNYISADTGTTTAYSPNGTLRYDMVSISGAVAAVPEPGAVLFGGLVCSVLGIAVTGRRLKTWWSGSGNNSEVA